MIDRKKIREITGYTHQKQINDPDSWYKGAISFHESAHVLYEAQESITLGSRVFTFNAALSLELILKAILVAKKINFKFTHTLRALADNADIELNDDQKHTLDLLTAIFTWVGRYPAPKLETEWDQFHDAVFEKHIIRSKIGNTNKSMANPKTYPSMANYMAIWEICLTKYKELITDNHN